MKIISFLVSIFLLFSLPAYSEAEQPVVRWDCLNLSINQQKQINALDTEWQNQLNYLKAKIFKSQENLKKVLSNPNSTELQIKTAYEQVFAAKDELRKLALENFLKKRRILTGTQKQVLHRMLFI